MPLVPAKCPECGGTINIDPAKKAGICEYCKQPFVVEEAINNYNTVYNIKNEIKADVVNIESVLNIQNKVDDILLRFEMGIKRKNDYEDKILNEALIDFNRLIDENSHNLELKYLYIQKSIEIIELLLNGETLNTYCGLSSIVKFYEYLKEANYFDSDNCFEVVEEVFKKIDEIVMSGNVIVNQGCWGGNSMCRVDFHNPILHSQVDLVIDFLSGYCIEPYKGKIKRIENYINELKMDWKNPNHDMNQGIMYGKFEFFRDYGGEGESYLAKLEKCIERIEDVDEYYSYLHFKYKEYLNECIEKKICSNCGKKLTFFGKCKTCSNGDISYDSWRYGNTDWVRG